jgi:hypothetical protein
VASEDALRIEDLIKVFDFKANATAQIRKFALLRVK